MSQLVASRVQRSVAARGCRRARLPAPCCHHPQKLAPPFGAAGGGAAGLDASSSPRPGRAARASGSRRCPRGSREARAPVSPGRSDLQEAGEAACCGGRVPGRRCQRQGQAAPRVAPLASAVAEAPRRLQRVLPPGLSVRPSRGRAAGEARARPWRRPAATRRRQRVLSTPSARRTARGPSPAAVGRTCRGRAPGWRVWTSPAVAGRGAGSGRR